jgi:hypothetical protein
MKKRHSSDKNKKRKEEQDGGQGEEGGFITAEQCEEKVMSQKQFSSSVSRGRLLSLFSPTWAILTWNVVTCTSFSAQAAPFSNRQWHV